MVQDPKSESPKAVEEAPVDIEKEIRENMGAGKKHFLCSDYPNAVACFQEACKLLSDKYGQLSQECCDAYYYYGVSLLELSRLENGVLGNALRGVPEEEEGSDTDGDDEQFEKPDLTVGDREKLREDVEAAMATEDEEEGEEADAKEGMESEQKPDEKLEKSEEKKEEEKTSKEEPDGDKEIKSKVETEEGPSQSSDSGPSCSKLDETGKGEDEDSDNADDIPNMQLAWEMLELAKVLYARREKNKENSLMVAQCFSKLGELGLEGELYQLAIGDFQECLALQKEYLAGSDRKLAETYYNLGLANSFGRRHDDALEHYRNALSVLEARVDLLEELVENKEVSEDADSMAKCKEVGEIKDLIPDINSKIEDVLSVKKQSDSGQGGSLFGQALGETTTGFGAAAESSGASCSTIPVRKVTPVIAKESTSDISHLVRRKRPSPDEEGSASEADVDSKKLKQEDHGSNGRSTGEDPSKNGNGSGDIASSGDVACSQKQKKAEAGDEENVAAALKEKVSAAGDAPVAMES